MGIAARCRIEGFSRYTRQSGLLFSAHMVQHMVLVMVVPIFLALSAPVTLAARALPVRHDASWGPREWLLRLVLGRPRC